MFASLLVSPSLREALFGMGSMSAGGRRLQEAVRRAAVTREVELGADVLGALPAALVRALPAPRYTLVADPNTWAVAGERLTGLIEAAGLALTAPEILSETPRLKPRVETARGMAEAFKASGATPIALGAGVINDLTKYAASLVDRAYACVPTAASMDGYAASGAALRDGGFKRTFACPPPTVIVADLDLVATAPAAMAGWGYGDLAGKIVAGADWILADVLGVEAIAPAPFAMVQDNLADWLADPAGVQKGDRGALDGLMRGLLISGFAMQAHNNSRPASGSDHQFAHLWEMEGIAVDGMPVSHGVCVGIGCLSMLAAYAWLLDRDIAGIDPVTTARRAPDLAAMESEVAASFPLPFMAEAALAECRAKPLDQAEVRMRLTRLKARWPELSARLHKTLPAPATVRALLAAAGAPTTAQALGIGTAKHAADYRRARLIRRRYTALDLLQDLGLLDLSIAAIFAPAGFWGSSPA